MVKSAFNAVDGVVDRLRTDIVDGRLPPGSRLRLGELAERYRVGQMPLREALRRLQGEDLVTTEPNRGASVRSVDAGFVANLFDIRIALETLLARRAAEHIEPGEITALGQAHRAHQRAVRAGDWSQALVANAAFHTIINAASRNPLAAELLDRHWRLIAGLWHRYGFVEHRFARIVDDHAQILEALQARDADAAATLMTTHTAQARRHLLARMFEHDLAGARQSRTRSAPAVADPRDA